MSMNRFILALLISFCLLDFYSSRAQSKVYHPFPDSSATWSVSCGGFELPFMCSAYDHFYNADTLINKLSYHKLFYEGYVYPVNSMTGYCDYTHSYYGYGYAGALREDSNKRIWFIHYDSIQEALLYRYWANIQFVMRNLRSDIAQR